MINIYNKNKNKRIQYYKEKLKSFTNYKKISSE